jgi:23S rRNA (adenine2503-C2)-methyltransferase
MSKKLIFDLDYKDLSEQLREWSIQNFRTKQLWQGLYNQLYDSVESFTTIPQILKDTLTTNYSFSGLTAIDEIQSKNGQTKKVLFKLKDGLTIESVLMHYKDRETVCVSTQVGCAVGCTFCATGKMGLHRNLTPGEIVEQVLFFERILTEKMKKVTNIVFMGMGEPFQNFENSIKAIDILHHPEGLNLGERRFTISTVGIPDKIRQFANMNRQINLAVSLHTPFNQKRTEIVPINRRFPINDVMAAVKYYLDKTNRRVSFEYALIAGENDSPKEALALAELLRGLICHVNLIPVNPIGTNIQATTRTNVLKFQRLLEENGIPCSVRLGRGVDIQAGCGQLASRSN